MVFYNGFNLMVDVIIAATVGWLAYRAGVNNGINLIIDWLEEEAKKEQTSTKWEPFAEENGMVSYKEVKNDCDCYSKE